MIWKVYRNGSFLFYGIRTPISITYMYIDEWLGRSWCGDVSCSVVTDINAVCLIQLWSDFCIIGWLERTVISQALILSRSRGEDQPICFDKSICFDQLICFDQSMCFDRSICFDQLFWSIHLFIDDKDTYTIPLPPLLLRLM